MNDIDNVIQHKISNIINTNIIPTSKQEMSKILFNTLLQAELMHNASVKIQSIYRGYLNS